MNDKDHINRVRSSAGTTEIGTAEDGAIMEMLTVGGRLLVIKERSIYEMVFADKIDPNRTNISLPRTINKLIIDKGTDSELVTRTFLTAKTLFRPEYMPDTIDCDVLLGLAVDLLSEISVLEKEVQEYLDNEGAAAEHYEQRKTQNLSFEVPAIVNLETKCKTIFQKADHVEQILIDVASRFYTNAGITKQSHFPKLYSVLVEKYGEENGFAKFVDSAQGFMKIIRELRNGLDHRLDSVTVTNYQLQPNGSVLSPTIELKRKDVTLNRISIAEFLKITMRNMVEITEATFAFLGGHNVKEGQMQYQVRFIPEDKRRNKYLNYCFWMPFGEGGYYSQ